jgi:hypothetical protein
VRQSRSTLARRLARGLLLGLVLASVLPGAGVIAPARAAGYDVERRELEARIRDYETRRELLLIRFTEAHPDVLAVDRTLDELRRRLDELPEPSGGKKAAGRFRGDQRSPDRQTPKAGPWFPAILKPTRRLYLPDFSYAGYRWGADLPESPRGRELAVVDFGAVPDDGLDDTAAIREALDAAHRVDGSVVVRLPPGRLIVRDILWIRRSDLTLVGAGAGRTRLAVPVPLAEMEQPAVIERRQAYYEEADLRQSGELYSPYSWTGGVVWTQGPGVPPTEIAGLTGGARGSHVLVGRNVPDLAPGTVVQVRWCNAQCNRAGFLDHVFDRQAVRVGRRTRDNSEGPIVTQEVTVSKVQPGRIEIVEELMHDIRPSWDVRLATMNYLTNVAIEGMTVEFPDTSYAGHLLEDGYNAFYLTDLLHSWVRDVEVVNADSGIIAQGCKNLTLQGIRVTGRGGHKTISIAGSIYVLVHDFELDAPSVHNPTFGTGARLSVYADGSLDEARLDQHQGLNHQNLFDDLRIEMRDIGRVFDHGGARHWRPTAGAFNTFWNIRVDFAGHSPIKVADAPSARIVGLHGSGPIVLDYGPNAYIEGLNRARIAVPSLYEYQRSRRNAGGD